MLNFWSFFVGALLSSCYKNIYHQRLRLTFVSKSESIYCLLLFSYTFSLCVVSCSLLLFVAPNQSDCQLCICAPAQIPYVWELPLFIRSTSFHSSKSFRPIFSPTTYILDFFVLFARKEIFCMEKHESLMTKENTNTLNLVVPFFCLLHSVPVFSQKENFQCFLPCSVIFLLFLLYRIQNPEDSNERAYVSKFGIFLCLHASVEKKAPSC